MQQGLLLLVRDGLEVQSQGSSCEGGTRVQSAEERRFQRLTVCLLPAATVREFLQGSTLG